MGGRGSELHDILNHNQHSFNMCNTPICKGQVGRDIFQASFIQLLAGWTFSVPHLIEIVATNMLNIVARQALADCKEYCHHDMEVALYGPIEV